MSHAAALPRPQLDAKRIIATSGAIAVHVGILMMLMMPPRPADTAAETVIVEPTWVEAKKLPPPPPPPPKPEAPHVVQQQQVVTPVPIVDPPVVPPDATASAVDIAIPDLPDAPPNSFTEAPAVSPFQELAIAAGAAPPYPRPAIAHNIEGTVLLRIHVDASGKPMEVIVEKSSGSRILDEAALKFVKARWRFVPAQSNGQAVEAWGLVPIEFVLE